METARRRKSMAAPRSAIVAPSENWLVNRAALIAEAQKNMPFSGVAWECAIWDVSDAYRHRTRGYNADRPVQRLLFTRHSFRPGEAGRAFEGPFGDVVKSLVCVRHRQRGQSAMNHMVFVRATRYVHEALADKGYEIGELSADNLDVAAAELFGRERESSAYKVVGYIEEFADMLDRNGLCRQRLDWRYRRKYARASSPTAASQSTVRASLFAAAFRMNRPSKPSVRSTDVFRGCPADGSYQCRSHLGADRDAHDVYGLARWRSADASRKAGFGR